MLRGSLEEFALSDIFLLIAGARKTGRLEISRRAGSGGVYFRDGEIYFAESSLTREPLGQKLIRAGVLSERDLMKALDEHASSGMRVGEVLVRNGAIDKSQLAVAIRSQVQDAVSDCLKWEVGEFEFESSSEVVAEIPIRVTVDYVIMEASRLIDDVAGTERKIRSRKMVLQRVADAREAKQVLRLSTGEERIFLTVDGERQVSGIIADAGGDELTVLRTLHGLLSAGMVKVVPTATREPEPLAYAVDPVRAAEAVSAAVEEAPAETDEVDLEMPLPTTEVFRESGDEIISAEAEAEAEINSIAATPPAPPPPILELPAPVEEWFEDPELKKDTVIPEAAEEAPPAMARDDLTAALEASLHRHEVGPPSGHAEAPEPIRAGPPQPPVAEVHAAPEADAAPIEADEIPEADAAPIEVRETSAPPSSLRIDRAVVVRELASLFSEDDTPSTPAAKAPGNGGYEPSGGGPRGLEDDDDLDRGLIHRLIDGVKGL